MPIPDARPAREKGSAGPAAALSCSLPACGGGKVRGRPEGLCQAQDVHRQIERALRALIRNDLAVLAAIEGKFDEARTGWQEAVEVDPDCLLARLNRDLVEAEVSLATVQNDFGELKLAQRQRLPPLWGKVARRTGWGERLPQAPR